MERERHRNSGTSRGSRWQRRCRPISSQAGRSVGDLYSRHARNARRSSTKTERGSSKCQRYWSSRNTTAPHAVWSENLPLVQMVFERGAKSGATLALHNAMMRGNCEITKWLVDNAEPDIRAKNFQGKTPLEVQTKRNNERVVELLRRHGAGD